MKPKYFSCACAHTSVINTFYGFVCIYNPTTTGTATVCYIGMSNIGVKLSIVCIFTNRLQPTWSPCQCYCKTDLHIGREIAIAYLESTHLGVSSDCMPEFCGHPNMHVPPPDYQDLEFHPHHIYQHVDSLVPVLHCPCLVRFSPSVSLRQLQSVLHLQGRVVVNTACHLINCG